MAPPSASSSRSSFILAAAALLAIDKLLPFGNLLLYPLTLLATWVHEMGHGLAALAVGGHFDRLEIFRDASGLAWTWSPTGLAPGIVAAAGLLAPPLVGFLTLALVRGPRRARLYLLLLALGLVTSLAIWVRTATGWVAMPAVALSCALVALGASGGARLFVAQLLGLCLALDTVTRIDYLFKSSVKIAGVDRASDVAGVAAAFGGSYLFWGTFIAAVALTLVGVGLLLALRKS